MALVFNIFITGKFIIRRDNILKGIGGKELNIIS